MLRASAVLVVTVAALSIFALPATAQTCRAVKLRVNALENPISVDTPQPRFSWQIADSRRGARQTAYRIVVAAFPSRIQNGQPVLWDSGKVLSDQCIEIPYAGKPLVSR